MTNITRSELLDLIHRFYPQGVHNFDRMYVPPGEPFYDDTVRNAYFAVEPR